ncbi:MAG: lytic transglycosylase domain-containing protein [Desulfobacteraceae bacterium]|nr:lytic transglycosylase domain-containing protein [Desulfobacteraceae bacterium]
MLLIPLGICSQQHKTSECKWPIAPPYNFRVSVESFKKSAPTVKTTSLLSKNKISNTKKAEPDRKKNDLPYYEDILRASKAYQVDVVLIRAIIMAESGNNPRAVSYRGAKGLMQLMPTTAKSLGVKDLFNPAHNIDGGVRYFRKLLDRFENNINLALAAYNAGSRYVKKYGGVPPFRATRSYIKKVLKYKNRFQKELNLAHAEKL